jgi:hypothetical protein
LRRRGNELQIGSSTPPNITGLEDRRPGRLNEELGDDVVGERDLDRLTSDVSDLQPRVHGRDGRANASDWWAVETVLSPTDSQTSTHTSSVIPRGL